MGIELPDARDWRKSVNGKNSKACHLFLFPPLHHTLDLPVLLGKIA
jgi:hypothetical protein